MKIMGSKRRRETGRISERPARGLSAKMLAIVMGIIATTVLTISVSRGFALSESSGSGRLTCGYAAKFGACHQNRPLG